MNRRGLLAWVSASGAILTAGCLSSLPTPIGDTPTPTPSAIKRCADRKFPERHLGIIELEESKRPDDPSIVIRFEELPPAEQAIVEHAIERGRYAICLPAAQDDRVDQFNSLVKRIKDHTPSVPNGAYLKRGDTYHQFTHVRTRDQVFVTAHT